MLSDLLEGLADFLATTWAFARKGERNRPMADERWDWQADGNADWNTNARTERMARRRAA